MVTQAYSSYPVNETNRSLPPTVISLTHSPPFLSSACRREGSCVIYACQHYGRQPASGATHCPQFELQALTLTVPGCWLLICRLFTRDIIVSTVRPTNHTTNQPNNEPVFMTWSSIRRIYGRRRCLSCLPVQCSVRL